MAIALEGTPTVGESAAATSVSCNVPTGTASGEVLVAYAAVQHGANIPAQTGWTAGPLVWIGSISVGIFARVATASEPASYAFSSLTSGVHTLMLARYSGVDTTNIFDMTGVTATTASGTTVTVPTMTTVTDGALALFVTGVQSSATTRVYTATTAGPIEVIQSTGTGRRGYGWREPRPTAGALGTRVFTLNVALPLAAAGVALRPAASTAGSAITRYNGTTWVNQNVERYNGTSWVPQTLTRF